MIMLIIIGIYEILNMKMIDNILELNGLSVEILKELSYQSKLGMSIKKNLHYFDRDILLKELFDMAE